MKNKKTITNILFLLNGVVVVAMLFIADRLFKMHKANLAFTILLINLFFMATFFILFALKSKYKK